MEATDAEITAKIREILPTLDLENMGLKAFVKRLSQAFNQDLKSRKAFIKDTLTQLLNENENTDDEDDEDNDESSSADDDDEDIDSNVPKKRKPKKRNQNYTGGLNAKKEISDQLADFLGQGKTMARTAIVQGLWEYIRRHNLQNPDNRREILLDSKMQSVFGCTTFTMYTMSKYISAHVHPFPPVNLTTTTTTTATKTPSQKRRTTAARNSPKKKRKTGTQPPYHLSDALQVVVGTNILPRPQVVKKIWEYIKGNNLQDPNDKRQILCDEALRRVMGKDRISMFQMNVKITNHLLEKADPNEYQHEVSDSE